MATNARGSVPHTAHVDSTSHLDSLLLDLLEWLSAGPRPYADTLEAWRTSCPRLPVWEEANDRGFIARHHERGHGAFVSVSPTGAAHLREHRGETARSPAG